jgi:hypothetical protein
MTRTTHGLLGLLAALALTACKSGPEVKAVGAPELTAQDLAVAEQGLTEFKVRFTGKVSAPEAATIEKATYELVVDQKVVKKGEEKLGIAVAAGQTADFSLEESSAYVATAEELKAMDTRGGSQLAAVRGKVTVRMGQKAYDLDYARSREIRVPRLPHAKVHEIDAARYSPDEANATFYLGVDNPNPFPVKLNGLKYTISISGKQLAEGVLGKGEKVSASSTGVFETQFAINQETYGKEVTKLIKTLTLPYVVKGDLTGDLFTEPFEFKGDIKLNVSK